MCRIERLACAKSPLQIIRRAQLAKQPPTTCGVYVVRCLLQLTKPVFDMLDRVTAIGTNDLANAQAMVANVSSTVQKMSDSIQSATVDKIDSFQTSYLGKAANSSAEAAGTSTTDRLVKAVHAVYYVSVPAAHTAVDCQALCLIDVLASFCCNGLRYTRPQPSAHLSQQQNTTYGTCA